MKKSWQFILALFFLGLTTYGQQSEFEDKYDPQIIKDTSFFEDLSEKLTTKLVTDARVNRFSITDSSGAYSTDFVPNDAVSFGFGLNYKYFGLAASFIPISARNESKYGKTQRLDLQANMYTQRIGIDFRMNYYKGFYVSNASSLNPNYSNDMYIKRADISTVNIGADVFYIFNGDEFSFRSVLTNTQWQKKSAGTFFAGVRFIYFRVEGDTILAPVGIVDSLNPSEFSTRITAYSGGIIGGYAYTWVIKQHFFISAAIGPTISVIGGNKENGIGSRFEERANQRIGYTLRGGAGYNSEKYFAGVSVFHDESELSFANLTHNRWLFRFYVGMRFF